jgi:hypothetical protein
VHYYVRISSITFSMDLKDVLPCIKNMEIISIIMMALESNFHQQKNLNLLYNNRATVAWERRFDTRA